MGFGNEQSTPRQGGFRGGFRGGQSSGRGFRGGSRGGSRGGFRGGRGRSDFDMGPPQTVEPAGEIMHPCEGQLVLKSKLTARVPYFNAPIYLDNMEQIGKVDEIFGPINDYYFSVSMMDNMNANSFEKGKQLFIDPRRLLPLERFLPQPPGAAKSGRGRGGAGFGRGGGRGGAMKRRGGGGSFRGAKRGRFGGGGRGRR